MGERAEALRAGTPVVTAAARPAPVVRREAAERSGGAVVTEEAQVALGGRSGAGARVGPHPARRCSRWIDRARPPRTASRANIRPTAAGSASSSACEPPRRRSLAAWKRSARRPTQPAAARRDSRRPTTARRFSSARRRELRACRAPAPRTPSSAGNLAPRGRPASAVRTAPCFSRPAPPRARAARTARIRRCRSASSDHRGTRQGCSVRRAASPATPSDLVNRGITRGLLSVLATMSFSGGCSSTTTHGDGGAAAGRGGQGGASGGGAGVAGGGGAAGQASGDGGKVDGGSCRLEGQSCSDPQRCCGPLICTGICTIGVTQIDSGVVVDASDASVDAGSNICARIRSLVLSNPMIISGPVGGGQTVTMQITLSDTDPNGFVSYPAALLTSSTFGVTFPADQAGPPGAFIDGTTSKSITFSVKLAASISSGTAVQVSARPVGEGHTAADCNASVLSFSLTTT